MTISDEDLKAVVSTSERGEALSYIDPKFAQEMATELLARRIADKWKSVKDKPPEAWKEVLLADFTPSECNDFVYCVGYRYDDGNQYIGRILDPTHWCELPEPPEAQNG
jgi:hypothetical protein